VSTEAAEQAIAVELCGCGGELPIAGFVKCYGCMTDEEAQAIANHFNRQAIAVMRGRDRAVAVLGLNADAVSAQAALEAARGELPALEDALKTAIAVERLAQDNARQAAARAHERAEEERRAQRDKASLERQEDALVRARAAADIAQRQQAALEGAAATRADAETALAALQQKVAGLGDAAAAANAAVASPPALVPMRELTAIAGHPLMVLGQPDADDYTKACVSIQVEAVAGMCGVTDRIRAEARQAGYEEAEAKAHKRPVLVPAGDGASSTLISPTGTWRGGRH
jgi:hypothetical protein